jgi:alkylation response protein AidB-like acyl-CoA dehydrogenase
VVASAVVAAAGRDDLQARLLPGLAAGTTIGAFAVAGGGEVSVDGGSGDGSGTVSGKVVVLGGGTADVIVVPIEGSDDVALVATKRGDGVTVDVPTNLDPTRRAARVTFTQARADIVPGGRRALVDLGRTILAAEATGVAREATEQAAEYAKVREQFGRPIAMYQAVNPS